MKGATAVPEVNTTRLPSRTRQMIMGNSQNFFRSLIKDQSSNKNSLIGHLLCELCAVSNLWDSAAYRSRLTAYFNLTAYRLLISTVALDGMPAGACGQHGSCRDQVSTAGPWDLFPAIV